MATTSWSGQRSSFPKPTRQAILRRDPRCRCTGWCNQHQGRCTQRSTIADHIVPHAEGGQDTASNGQGLCVPCHDVKTKAEQARGRARKDPRRRPEQHPGIRPR